MQYMLKRPSWMVGWAVKITLQHEKVSKVESVSSQRQEGSGKWEKLSYGLPQVPMRTPADSWKDHEMELQQTNYTVIESQTLWISSAVCLLISACLSLCLTLSLFLPVALQMSYVEIYCIHVCYRCMCVCVCVQIEYFTPHSSQLLTDSHIKL